MVELLDRADQAERALLDEVEERQAATEVALGDRHDEAQVRLDHVLLGLHVTALDALGERDLELRRQQRDPADRAQVQTQRVERRLDGEVELRLLGHLRGAVDRRLARRSGRFDLCAFGLCVAPVGTDDVDALVRQVGVQLVQLLLGDLHFLERRGDVVERQEPALVAFRDQRAKLVQLIDRRFVRQQHFCLYWSAPLRAGHSTMWINDAKRRPRRI